MCDCYPNSADVSGGQQLMTPAHGRRAVLSTAARVAIGLATASGVGLGARLASASRSRPSADVAASPDAVEVLPGLWIRPREAWGADLPPTGDIQPEEARFLLVHHTASPSNYATARSVIRSVYSYQTGPAKGWNDVCYEFFIGRDGDVWEGRAGALAGPVVADATGGSQGYAQLICLLGDFSDAPPTQAALDSLIRVLAWLSGRYAIDITAGSTTSFTSRGSQRWPAGAQVTTPTIAGHRDMSYTECPGTSLYTLLPDIRELAGAQRDAWRTALKPARRLGP